MDINCIVPTYNCGAFIGKAVASLCAQRSMCRIVVVDDASTDDTQSVLASFSDRIHVLYHPQRKGANAARNTGLNFIQQKYGLKIDSYVAFCDADAIYYLDFTKTLVEAIESSGCTFAYSQWHQISGDGSQREMKLSEWDTEKLWWDVLTIPMPAMIRALCLPHDGLPEAPQSRDDWKLWLWMAERGSKGKLVEEYLFAHWFRPHGKTMTLGRDLGKLCEDRARTRRKFASLSGLPQPVAVVIESGSAEDLGHAVGHLALYSGIPVHVVLPGPPEEGVEAALDFGGLSWQIAQTNGSQLKGLGDSYVLRLAVDAYVAPDCVERLLWWRKMMPSLGAVGPLLLDNGKQSLLKVAEKEQLIGQHLLDAWDKMPDMIAATMRLGARRYLVDDSDPSEACLLVSPGSGEDGAVATDALCLYGEWSKRSRWIMEYEQSKSAQGV